MFCSLEVFSCVFLTFVMGIYCLFLLHFVHQQKLKIKALNQENEQTLLLKKQKQENPLGRLFSTDTKSLTLSLKKDGKIVALNDSLLELLGYTKKQLVGKNIYDTLMPPPSKQEPLEMNIINRIVQNPKLYAEHETELITKDGKKVWISWTNRIIIDKTGKVTEIRSVGFDITARKDLEEELHPNGMKINCMLLLLKLL